MFNTALAEKPSLLVVAFAAGATRWSAVKPRVSNEVKEDQFHRIERRYGTFSRSFSLPSSVDATKISAEHRNGVLTVRPPAREEAKPRQIKVDVRG